MELGNGILADLNLSIASELIPCLGVLSSEVLTTVSVLGSYVVSCHLVLRGRLRTRKTPKATEGQFTRRVKRLLRPTDRGMKTERKKTTENEV